ncbi:MAG: hypothetical protein IPP51_09380 [Bacteroidetes bacterium]|nr:hypothetical protein [Bacteroidota bacterium]
MMGFIGDGIVLGVFNNYSLKPEITTAFAKGEIVKVNADANKKDSTYWTTVRPVPLTNAEEIDYHRRDSTRIVHQSKSYLDSVDHVNNKFSVGDIFTGYSWDNSYYHRSYRIGSPLEQLNFNTVEGWNATMKFSYTKEYGETDKRTFNLSPELRYGWSNKHWNGHVAMNYRYNTKRLAVISADAGTDAVQFNGAKPISELVNSIYTLIDRKNFMKLYEKKYISAGHVSEIVNGLGFGLFAEYSERSTLSNTTDYSLYKAHGREYTSNIPVTPATTVVDFPTHHALILEAKARIRFGQTFITRPEGKYIMGTEYPTIRLAFRKGIPTVGDVDFDYFKASIEDDMRAGLLGKLSYVVSYGQFLSSRRLFFPDYIHFNGNKTFLSDFRLAEYKNLDYYTYSTSRWAMEAHAEHNFGGFFPE